MCLSVFSQCATLSPNVPHGIIYVPKGEWEERTNCPMTLQSASRLMQGFPALQLAINLSLSSTNSPFVCLPFASLTLAIKVSHTCFPQGFFLTKSQGCQSSCMIHQEVCTCLGYQTFLCLHSLTHVQTRSMHLHS